MSENCAFESVLQLFGQKHVLSILRLLTVKNPRGFNEIKEALNINPKTLTDRLRDLVKKEIIVREPLNQIPRKVNYRFTEKGEDLIDIFKTISTWNEKYPAPKISPIST